MFLDQFKAVVNCEDVTENNKSELVKLFHANKESFKNIKTEKELDNYINNKEDNHYLYYLLLDKNIHDNICGYIDFNVDCPKNGTITINNILVDSKYLNVYIEKDVLIDFSMIALKEYSEILFLCEPVKEMISFWNSLGYIVVESQDSIKIHTKSID